MINSISLVEVLIVLFGVWTTYMYISLQRRNDKMGFEVEELKREMGEMEVVVIRVIEEIHNLKARLDTAVIATDWSGVVEVTTRMDAAEKALAGVLPVPAGDAPVEPPVVVEPPVEAPVEPPVAPPTE
jgi:hypothetical protein